MSDQLYILKWNCHEKTLIQNLPSFLENDILTDVTLSVGAQQIKAHRAILAMCSVYFLQIFQEMQTTHPVVVLHNVSFEEINAILSFMYKGQCVVTQEKLPSLLSVARLLKIQGLCDIQVPDSQLRNEETTKRNEKIKNKLAINENIGSYDYTTYRERSQFGKTELKRQNTDHISMYDFKRATERCKTPIPVFEEKLPAVIDETIPIQSQDKPHSFAPKEPTETCKCFLCGKYLSNQYNLRVHMETHEEAYHACRSCPHVSRSRDALRKHVSYRHPEEYQNRKRKKTSGDDVNEIDVIK